MPFDVASARGLFPALGGGWIHFDAQAGMQVPDAVAVAVGAAVRSRPVAPGANRPQALSAADGQDAARRAFADLLGADASAVVLGPSRAALLSGLIESLTMAGHRDPARREGQLVVSRLDDEAVLVPWARAARRWGVSLAWAEIDVDTGVLPVWQYDELLQKPTQVVSVTLASSVTGVIADVARIAEQAQAAGALTVVDATAAAPYEPLDIGELQADAMLVDARRWGGPAVAALVFADPGAITALPPIAFDAGVSGPARLEEEPMPAALLAGAAASIGHLAGLDPEAIGKRRQRLISSLGGVSDYLRRLAAYLVHSLDHLGHVRVIAPDAHRIPAVSFTVDGVDAETVCRRLSDNRIGALARVPSRALTAMGVDGVDGAITVGLAPYSMPYEIDQLARVLGSLG